MDFRFFRTVRRRTETMQTPDGDLKMSKDKKYKKKKGKRLKRLLVVVLLLAVFVLVLNLLPPKKVVNTNPFLKDPDALPMIAASLLTPEPVTLENVPDIADVDSMLVAAARFGAQVVRDRRVGTVTLCTPRMSSARIDPELAAKISAAVTHAASLVPFFISRSFSSLLRSPAAADRDD